MEEYDVVACSTCGFVYADKIPSQDKFDQYYADLSKYEFNSREGKISSDYLIYYEKIANFLISYEIDKKARILDIGCSTGGLLSVLKNKGFSDLIGIDPSPFCVESVKKRFDICATKDTISSFSDVKKFDIIILSAVLEHLFDFDSSMIKIKELLNESGLLFIEIPDAERFQLYISAPFQQFSIEHINYFSQKSIKNLLIRFNFKILNIHPNESKLNQVTEPDLFVLATKTNDYSPNLIKDDISEPKIREYITQCLAIDQKNKKNINDKLSNIEKIIVWGVGTHTQRLLGSGLEYSKIKYFVDSNIRYQGKELHGIEIRKPDQIDNEETPILISTFAYQKEIIHQIKNVLNLKNEIITIY